MNINFSCNCLSQIREIHHILKVHQQTLRHGAGSWEYNRSEIYAVVALWAAIGYRLLQERLPLSITATLTHGLLTQTESTPLNLRPD